MVVARAAPATAPRRLVAVTVVVLLAAGCSGRAERTPPVEQHAAGADAPTAAPGVTSQPGGTPTTRPVASASPGPAPSGAPEAPPAVAATVAAVVAARTPAQLAAVLTAAERAIRDPRVSGAALAEAGHAQQRAYRRLGLTPRWRAAVVRRLPSGLRSAARNNIDAGRSLTALVTPQQQLPDWRIIRPPASRRLLRAYRGAARDFGLQWQYLAAIHLVETRMGRIRGTSTAGAQGPMQFMPATWDAYGRGDVNDPDDAIAAAARYLAAHGAPGDMDSALWHYNHSDRYVAAVSAYARAMIEDPRAYRGYYHWQVYYTMPDGVVHLPVGYGR